MAQRIGILKGDTATPFFHKSFTPQQKQPPMPKTGIILTICAVAVICITAAAQKKTTNYQSMNEMETLDLKWQDMVAIACLEAKGDVDRLAQAIRNGLDSGLTVNQIKEALSQQLAHTPQRRTNPHLRRWPRLVSGVGRAGTCAQTRRRGEHSCRSKTLAWSCLRQLVSTHCHCRSCRGGKYRMVRTSDG